MCRKERFSKLVKFAIKKCCWRIFKTKNPKKPKIPLKYFGYGFGMLEPMKFNSQSIFLEKISKWKFEINPLSKTISLEVEKYHQK